MYSFDVKIESGQLRALLPMIEANEADLYAPLISTATDEYGIDTPVRMAAFLAQMAHESGQLSRWVENLNYSAQRLMAVWPKRFPTLTLAAQYARQPEKLANFVYANRNGNGDRASGDGWRYRGRGPFQITGRDNYNACARALKLPLIAEPELLETPAAGFRSAAWYWYSRDLSPLADLNTDKGFEAITRRINGGTVGLSDRCLLWQRAQKVLSVV